VKLNIFSSHLSVIVLGWNILYMNVSIEICYLNGPDVNIGSAIQLFVQVHVGVIYIIAGSGER